MIAATDIWNEFNTMMTVTDDIKVESSSCCSCDDITETDGFNVCTQCGAVIDNNIIDLGVDRQIYPNSLPGLEHTTKFDPLKPASSVGSWVGKPKRGQRAPSWLKRQHWGEIPGREQRQKKVFYEIDETCRKLGIPGMIADQAKMYYKLVSDYRIGRLKAMRVSCLYYACKVSNVPRDGGELAMVMGYNPKELTKTNDLFLKILRSLKGRPNGYMTITNCTFLSNTATDYVNQYTHKLGLPFRLNSEIHMVIRNVRLIGMVSNKSPIGMAAACTYFISQQYEQGIPKDAIARTFNVSLATFISIYKIMDKYDYMLFAQDFFANL